LSSETTEALRLPTSVAGLGLDVFAAPFKGTGVNGSVVLGAHMYGTDLALGPDQRIEFAFQAMTPLGKQTPGAFKVATLNFKPESRRTIQQSGFRVIDRLQLPPGRHQVRFVVHQPGGQTGSVVIDVEVPDYRKPLLMSGIVIASQEGASERTLLSDARLKSLLSSDPTTARRFTTRDVLTTFAEVYVDVARNPGDEARVNASVSNVVDGKPRSLPRNDTRSMTSEPGRSGYVTRIRLADFAPGDYVFTLNANSVEGTVKREVPFSIVN
jgi:hypothetical protein